MGGSDRAAASGRLRVAVASAALVLGAGTGLSALVPWPSDKDNASWMELTGPRFGATAPPDVVGVFAVPTTVPDAYSTRRNTPLAVAAPGVLANDLSNGGGSLTAELVSGPANGSLTLGQNGGFTYTPNTGFVGVDSFFYRAMNADGAGNAAQVSLTVKDIPTAVPDFYSVTMNTPRTVAAPGVLANDSTNYGGDMYAFGWTTPANGTLSSWNYSGGFTYTPAAGFTGVDSFAYYPANLVGVGNTATVTLSVSAVPTAVADLYDGPKNTPIVVAAPGVLTNDSANNGGAMTAEQVTGPAHGTLALDADGAFTYTPDTGFVGRDTFIYRAVNTRGTSAPAQVGLAVGDFRATLLEPPPGSTLTASTVRFRWTGGQGVDHYWIHIGSRAGAYDLLNRNGAVNPTTIVAALPTDGRTLYVRLWSRIAGSWEFLDYTLTAATTAAPRRAELISPAPGTSLTSSTVAFEWNGGLGVAQYRLHVGSSQGAFDIVNRDIGTDLRTVVAGLPLNGQPLYVRLWSLIGSTWQFADSTLTSVNTAYHRPPDLTSPAPSSTLAASTVSFEWTGGLYSSGSWFQMGTVPGGTDLVYGSLGNTLTTTVTNLPRDGRTLYVRLWMLSGSLWHFKDYQYRAVGAVPTKAELTSPPTGSILTSSTVALDWTGGRDVTSYWIWVGTAAGSDNLINRNPGTALTTTLANLPGNETKLYVRLWSRIGDTWQFNDYTWWGPLSVTPRRAELTSPPSGSTLSASTVALQWTGGVGVSEYRLDIGNTQGGSDLISRNVGTELSTVVTMPSDGRTLFVRLWSLIQGVWQFADYTLTAATMVSPKRAELVSPPSGSTLSASTIRLRWAGGLGVTRYWLYVGNTPGASDVLQRNVGTNLSTEVPVPADGRTLHVRLWSLINGLWQFQDSRLVAASPP